MTVFIVIEHAPSYQDEFDEILGVFAKKEDALVFEANYDSRHTEIIEWEVQ